MLFRAAIISATLAWAAIGPPAAAQMSAGSLKELLGKASDSALDKLSQPGAFSADDAIRISLPGASGKGIGDLMNLASKAGLTGDINGSLNRAAEIAASQAKPIFRAAIDKVTFRDATAILRGGNTGATDYLKKSTGAQIKARLTPLVRSALDRTGVMQQASQMRALGMSENKLTDYVSDKTSDGIFTYVGREEAQARKDPIGTGSAILKNFKF